MDSNLSSAFPDTSAQNQDKVNLISTTADESVNSVTAVDTSLFNAIVEEAVHEPTEEDKAEAALLDAARNLKISVYDDIPADVNTLSINGVDTFAREGLHFSKAKAKQGKTSMLAIYESAYISPKGEVFKIRRIGDTPYRVRHFDTEMKPYDTQQFKRQVLHLAGCTEEDVGDNYATVNMRGIIDNKMKKDMIEAVIKHDRADVVVIDGIVDLIDNFNEIDQSKELIAWLMYLANTYKVVLICVLHTNKNTMDHNMRGHLGTMSEQKCDTTTECEKDDKNGIVTVKCSCSRHRPFPEWAFTWDDNGNLVDADERRAEILRQSAEQSKAEREEASHEFWENRKQVMLSFIKDKGGCVSRRALTDHLMHKFALCRQSISPIITRWIKEGVILENGDVLQSSPQTCLFTE